MLALALMFAFVYGSASAQPEVKKHEPDAPAAPKQAVPDPETVTDPSRTVKTRARWPVGVPLFVEFSTREFRGEKPRTVKFTSDLPDAPTVEQQILPVGMHISPPRDMPWEDYKACVGTPAKKMTKVRFTAVDAADPRNAPARAEVALTLDLPVRVSGTVDDVLEGVAVPAIDQGLRKELNATFYRRGWQSNGSPRLWVGTYTNQSGRDKKYPGICHILAKHEQVTLAVKLEVLHDGKPISSSTGWWRGVKEYTSVTPFNGMLRVELLDAEMEKLDRMDGKWQLRITSDPIMALRDFESTKYWKGEVIAPLHVTDAADWAGLKQEEAEAPK
jgi:hypothetical protein